MSYQKLVLQTALIFATSSAVWGVGAAPAPQVRTYYPYDGKQFQQTLQLAQPGDTIVLHPSITYVGNFVLPAKTGDAWITIQSGRMDALPPAGTRIHPRFLPYMAKLVSPNGAHTIKAEARAHHYRLIGLEVRAVAGAFSWVFIDLGGNNGPTVADLPHDIELDRLYIHGDPLIGGKRGISLNSGATTIKNCYISDIKSNSFDAQAILGWNGPGPYNIVNNYLEASGENIVFGGALPSIHGVIPSDIVILQNHLFKPLSWRVGDPNFNGTAWLVKNLLEIKSARRVRVEGNVMENNWAHGQTGTAILLTVRTENGRAPWNVIEDVTFVRNLIRHAGGGVVILGRDLTGGSVSRVRFEGNIFDDIGTPYGSGRLFLLAQGTQGLVINHNTGMQTGEILLFDGSVPLTTGLYFTNNVMPHNKFGIVGGGKGIGIPGLNYYAPQAVVTGNVFPGGNPLVYPSGNHFPASLTSIIFTNIFTKDFRILPSSPFYASATDATPPGANVAALDAITAGALTGAFNPLAR